MPPDHNGQPLQMPFCSRHFLIIKQSHVISFVMAFLGTKPKTMKRIQRLFWQSAKHDFAFHCPFLANRRIVNQCQHIICFMAPWIFNRFRIPDLPICTVWSWVSYFSTVRWTLFWMNNLVWLCNTVFPEIIVKDYKIQDLFCRESSLSQETGWNAFWRSILNSICSMLMPKFLRDFLFNIRSIIVITKVEWIFYKHPNAQSGSFRNYFNLTAVQVFSLCTCLHLFEISCFKCVFLEHVWSQQNQHTFRHF